MVKFIRNSDILHIYLVRHQELSDNKEGQLVLFSLPLGTYFGAALITSLYVNYDEENIEGGPATFNDNKNHGLNILSKHALKG